MGREQAATVAELHLITEYSKYKRALKVVDDACIRADDLLRAAVKQLVTQPLNNCKVHSSHNPNSTATIPNPAATGTRSLDRTPALTPTERSLLIAHDGCFKCCVFYTSHKSADCPDSFLDKSSYVPLTEMDAMITKKCQGKKEKTPAVAVVIPAPVTVVMLSTILGDGSDSEYVIAPFFTLHFFLDCTVGGIATTSLEPVCALIDHGSDAVLITQPDVQ
jgi:hypothetical protein